MTARVARQDSGGLQPHWIRAIYRKVGGNAVEVVKVWRREGGQARLVYERVTDVVVTPQWPGTPVQGQQFAVDGTATDVKGLAVQQGKAHLEYLPHGGTSWAKIGNEASIVNGQYTIVVPSWSGLGDVKLRVWVDVDPPLLDSASAEKSYTVGLSTPSRPSGSSLTHTSIRLSWPALPGASGYEVYNGSSLATTVTGTASTRSGLSSSQQYNWRIRAYVTLPDGTKRYSAYSAYLYHNTGRAEVRDKSSKVVRVACANSGTHRNDHVGWGQTHVRQGYYSSSYGGDGYIGVFDYGSTSAVRNAIINSVGQTRYDKGYAHSGYTKVFRRGDVGVCNDPTLGCNKPAGCPVNVRFLVSKQGVGGARPALNGTAVVKSMNYNSWHQVTLNSSLLSGLTKGGYRSLCIHQNNRCDYAALNRHTAGPEDGDLWVTWAWDYVSQSYIAPRTWT